MNRAEVVASELVPTTSAVRRLMRWPLRCPLPGRLSVSGGAALELLRAVTYRRTRGATAVRKWRPSRRQAFLVDPVGARVALVKGAAAPGLSEIGGSSRGNWKAVQ
jgi:hypothetical protein